ncbi:MAG: AAA family ATPase [Candidatus Nanoarchaeia archaeon]|nr:AAA family ATPase [Candidatus Nanoarchaeia archaeon]
MIVKKIRLNNIRSYLIEEIEFPEGSTLLMGDVGSGKSSVLLAIEFALFGIKRPDLTGEMLLRKGSDEGYVELTINVDEKDYVIKRALKRTSSGVSQDTGYVFVEGAKREGTALELKEYVLKLLNYPKELITKSKSLIYRYTVYTPQEDMKLILLGETELRLDTLRKVFGIDKYKRISENSKIVLSKIKEKQKEYAGFISDLSQKIEQRNNYEIELSAINDSIKKIKPIYDELSLKIKEKNESLRIYEDKIKEEQELRKKLELNRLKINSRTEKTKDNLERIERINTQTEKLRAEIFDYDLEDIKKLILFKKEVLNETQKELDLIKNSLSEILVQENQSNKLRNDISELTFCPLCKQNVTDEHKHNILTKEEEKLLEFNIKKREFIGKRSAIEKRITDLIKEIDELSDKKAKAELMFYKKKTVEEKTIEKIKLDEELVLLKKEINILSESNQETAEKLRKFSGIEYIYKKEKNNLEALRNEFRDVEIKKVRFESEIDSINRNIKNVTNEIDEKIKQREKLNYITQLRTWIEESFLNMIIVMEKQVMLKVHYDFDVLFQNWFNIIMNNEDISINLDEEFTPKIVQNGHDIEYHFLSGGEKTAAALSYRLALNQVINNLVSDIKTRDLIILDEPTDGFSSEQLDRIKLVLDELNIKQILIVSHESKIESFVDNTIRFKKENHVSKII